MDWDLFRHKGWVFFINSGEDSRDEPNSPHVHARRGGKEAYVFFNGCFETYRVVAKKGKLDGNAKREIEKGLKTVTTSVAKSGISATRTGPSEACGPWGARIDYCKVTAATLTVELCDSRTLLAPTARLGPVSSAHWKERRRFRVINDGTAVEWPLLGYKVTLRQLMGVE